MASPIPRRGTRNVGTARARTVGWTTPEAAAGWKTREIATQSTIHEAETYSANVHLDFTRLLVAVVGLGAGVALPGALIVWVAYDVMAGLGSRVLALLP